MRYEVKSGVQTLTFEGDILSHSTSYAPGKGRWIEFTVYITQGGKYVVSRVGESLLYHHASCPTVMRNNIAPLPSQVISDDMLPCEQCQPEKDYDEVVFPEVARSAATTCDSADGVVRWMKQKDENGISYLTNVARIALEGAAKKDPLIKSAYYTERID